MAFTGFCNFKLHKKSGATKTITAITSAAPPSCTSTAHGLIDGDIAVFSIPTVSPFTGRNYFAARVNQTDTDAFTIDGLDFSSTAIYGSTNSGTVQKCNAGIAVDALQIESSAPSGGESATFESKSQGNPYSTSNSSTVSGRVLKWTVKAIDSASVPEWLKTLEEASQSGEELVLESIYAQGNVTTFDTVKVAPFNREMSTFDTSKESTFTITLMCQTPKATATNTK